MIVAGALGTVDETCTDKEVAISSTAAAAAAEAAAAAAAAGARGAAA